MGNQGVETLKGMDAFPFLEVLWLNDNLVHSVRHLRTNFRLKQLYLHNNKVETLAGSDVKYLASLEVLLLRNNNISDLKAQVSELGQLRCLRQLDLSENPCANETD